jgi:hypothetical protein
MSGEVLSGSCLCGSVAYEVRAPFKHFAHCHCSRCRKATGASHATNLYVDRANFAWLRGEELTSRYDLPSAQSFATTFCRSCGSPLPHHTRSGRTIVVPAGSLNQAPQSPPQAHIFWQSRASWAGSGGDVPKFDAYPEWWK